MNPFNTTVMPLAFRFTLVLIIFANTVSVLYYEYFVVNRATGKDFLAGSHDVMQNNNKNTKKVLELLEKTDRSDGSPFVNMALL